MRVITFHFDGNDRLFMLLYGHNVGAPPKGH